MPGTQGCALLQFFEVSKTFIFCTLNHLALQFLKTAYKNRKHFFNWTVFRIFLEKNLILTFLSFHFEALTLRSKSQFQIPPRSITLLRLILFMKKTVYLAT